MLGAGGLPMLRFALALSLVSSIAAFAHEDSKPEEKRDSPHSEAKEAEMSKDREAVDKDGVVRRGKALSKDTKAITVAEAIAQADKLAGKSVKIAGKVESACQ